LAMATPLAANIAASKIRRFILLSIFDLPFLDEYFVESGVEPGKSSCGFRAWSIAKNLEIAVFQE
jgi:hypothetical protein